MDVLKVDLKSNSKSLFRNSIGVPEMLPPGDRDTKVGWLVTRQMKLKTPKALRGKEQGVTPWDSVYLWWHCKLNEN